MSAQQRMKIANEKASKNITNRGNVVKSTVSKNSLFIKSIGGKVGRLDSFMPF